MGRDRDYSLPDPVGPLEAAKDSGPGLPKPAELLRRRLRDGGTEAQPLSKGGALLPGGSDAPSALSPLAPPHSKRGLRLAHALRAHCCAAASAMPMASLNFFLEALQKVGW